MTNRFTLKAKLTLWYMVVMIIILTIFSLYIYLYMEQYLYQHVNNELLAKVNIINKEFSSNEDNEIFDKNNFLSELEEEFDELSDEGTLMGFYDLSNNLVLGDQYYSVLPKKIIIPDGSSSGVKTDIESKSWKTYTFKMVLNNETIGWIHLAHNLQDEEEMLNRLLFILIIGMLLILVLSIGGGYFLSWKALAPIDKIINVAKEIKLDNLSHRIDGQETDDEIGRLIKSLNQLLRRLEDSYKREKQFTADASHELRTPIAVIRAQAEKVLRYKINDIDDDSKNTLQVIMKQSEYMSHLIDQLLLLARGDIDETLIREEINIAELVFMVVEEVRELAYSKQVILSLDIQNEEINIMADQGMIIQLLLNLLDNAIKYTPEGGKVSVSVKKLKKGVKIEVDDTGIGIPVEDQKYIFERFYRVDKARSRKKGGSGLGLSICRWIVESHGGNISLESRKNTGSTFIIYLPIEF